MRQPRFHRYFLAFLPNEAQLLWLESLSGFARQEGKRIRIDHYHLTLCVIAESLLRDCFIASRADAALSGYALVSCPFWLGRLRGGGNGAAVHAMGSRREIRAFYRTLIALLAKRGILPLHRKSGLNPHVTLGYDSCILKPLNAPCEWSPEELLLIESEVGNGVHNVLARWPLLPPPQGSFPFDAPPPRPLRLAA